MSFEAPLGGSKRKFGKNTKTWKIFESLFLDPTRQYPHVISPVPKGEAINLAMGLNCCNMQWAEEQGIPRDFVQFSAKAIRGADDSSWSLEISTNHRQQRTSSANWMDKYLSAENDTTSSPSGEAPRAEEQVYVPSPVSQQDPEISHMENALEGWLGAGRTPATTDESHAASGRYPLNTEGERDETR